ncbi:photoreceptor outer segment membrane glycoprotein 2-like isoform X2 [Cydia pomonella]|uniref:photoreceptor outer segment membrane glycoprotein 2-like isoform X2 n=2 Tax=Cydia pomonella TaxID=82600 RepID=UPI002ADD779E|nr:photoreceptor outer segment membrane glycoprotein 2-like isoform X2 [Cydia pomonella]
MCGGKKKAAIAVENDKPNHPAIVWGVWYLSLAALAMIICTLALFFCVSIVVETLQLDLLLSLSLLTGIVMLPTNFYLLYMISKGRKIDPYSRVLCWDLWVCMATIIILSFIGSCLCSHKIYHCKNCIKKAISKAMDNYRYDPKLKQLMDVIQWGIKCCGLNSYTDWFNKDWYDFTRDYEWDPISDTKLRSKGVALVTDSVPLSCCKTGSCISNYLSEMGTSSIHLCGCAEQLYETVMAALVIQLIGFSSVFVVEFSFWLYPRRTKQANTSKKAKLACTT